MRPVQGYTHNLDSWRVVSMDGIKAITKIRHIGREKFSIIEHSGTKLEVNSVIVASEILNCKAEKN